MAPLVDAFWNAPSCFWSVIQCYKKDEKTRATIQRTSAKGVTPDSGNLHAGFW